MNYSFDFNGTVIESSGTSRAEAFAKSCETYEWLLKIQEADFKLESTVEKAQNLTSKDF